MLKFDAPNNVVGKPIDTKNNQNPRVHSESINLIARAKSGCSQSFLILKELNDKILQKVLFNYRESIEGLGYCFNDILEEKNSILWSAICSYRPAKQTKFSSWLYNNTRFFCLKLIARSQNRKNTSRLGSFEYLNDNECIEYDIEDTRKEQLLDRDFLLREFLSSEIDRLDDFSKKVFTLKYIEHLKIKEIAQITGESISRISTTNKKTIDCLRDNIKKRENYGY